jgi:hypothetical protein
MLSKINNNRANGPLPVAFTAKTNTVPAQSFTLQTGEVAIHKTYEQYQTSQISQDASFISGEGSPYDKPGGLGLDYDLDRDAGSRI